MSFKLSHRSISKLEKVHPDMIRVVHRAIEVTKVDFGVIYGPRSLSEQKELYTAGRSQTMKSKHLIQDSTGYAHVVDLMAYVGGQGVWELNVYDELADAMKHSAIEENVKIRWGAAWHIPDIREWSGTMEEAMNAYIDLRRSQGRRPFIDGPHFELN